MARDRASPASGEFHRTAADVADARDRQWHFLCDAIWLPVASAAERPVAVEHDLSLVCDVPRRSSLREDQSRLGYARPRTDRTSCQSYGGDHRLPERQDDRSRWAAW